MHLSKSCHARGEKEDGQGSLLLLTLRNAGTFSLTNVFYLKDWSLPKEEKKEGKSLFWKPFGKRNILQDAEMHLSKSCHARGEKEDGQGSLPLLTLRNAGTFFLRTMEGRKTNRREGQYSRTHERFVFSVR
ncbi:hypothetical protein CDAR_116701 [Caerostris darwini]|uniref:Uncharacterized protein n=1 Tax=Caerostris darwini TaxID=1538125 RepID=A0AAV4R1F3_9ARAC|nr:hypothetical protein CDAR_116701 [Caerostris darwini]